MWGQCISQHFVKYVDSIKTHRQKKRKKKQAWERGWKTNIIWQVCGTFGSDSVIPSGSKSGSEERRCGRGRQRDRVNSEQLFFHVERWQKKSVKGLTRYRRYWTERMEKKRRDEQKGKGWRWAVIRLEGCKDVALFGTIASLKITFRYFMSVGRSVLCSSLTKNPKFPKANMSCCFGICCQSCIPVVKLHGRVWSTNLLFPYV